MRHKIIFTILVFVISFLVVGGFVINLTKKINDKRQDALNEIGVQFAGTVIKKDTITRFSRPKVVLCVDLSYSNTKSYFLLDKTCYSYLRVENNIASFVVPLEYSKLDSVAINMENNGLEQYFLKGKLIAEYPISIFYAYLEEDDLGGCFK